MKIRVKIKYLVNVYPSKEKKKLKFTKKKSLNENKKPKLLCKEKKK